MKNSIINARSKESAEVLLAICPMWDVSSPPLGVSYLASYLESKGLPVDIFDINIETYTNSAPERKELWKMENYNLWAWEDLFETLKRHFEEDLDRCVQEILKRDYKVVGFSLYGANLLFTVEFARRLKRKKPDLFIVFGGPTCSFLHEHPDMPVRCMVSSKTQKSFVEPGLVDAFVMQEGEEALFNLASWRLSGSIATFPGTILYSNGKYASSLSAPCSLIKDLDQIPYPAWEKFPLGLYSSRNILPILFSRGCINKCVFCNDWKIWQRKYRSRSALNIFKEMKTITEKYNVSNFQCNDLLFNGDIKMLCELSDYIIKADLNVRWSAQGTIRRDMKADLLKQLRKSGLSGVTYGVESLSEKVLKKMDKRYSFEDVLEVLKNTKEAGIYTAINLIVGFPNETEEDFDITKNRLPLLRKYIDGISSLHPCFVAIDADLEKDPQCFSIKLSDKDWCNYWEAQGSKNTYEVRKNRTKELSEFIKTLRIDVQFTGIYDEGDSLEEISRQKKTHVKNRDIFKWLILIFVSLYTFFYINYFWVYMILKNRVLLGGRKE